MTYILLDGKHVWKNISLVLLPWIVVVDWPFPRRNFNFPKFQTLKLQSLKFQYFNLLSFKIELGCLGNYNCILTESDIKHDVVTCKCIYVQINPIYLLKIALFLKHKKLQICVNSKYVNIDLDCWPSQHTGARLNIVYSMLNHYLLPS